MQEIKSTVLADGDHKL